MDSRDTSAARTGTASGIVTDPKSVQDLYGMMATMMEQLQGRFQQISDQIVTRIDDMQNRVDELEKSVADLMVLSGSASTSASNPNYAAPITNTNFSAEQSPFGTVNNLPK